ncbi:MAG: hypothetical protein AMJ53_08385 [Gammaproteobacteria bacterium SG8_11]|nr:MAG: hypothetical protein AMJ53_08385 [Gammaproteobacteria bacterium SG8_11]
MTNKIPERWKRSDKAVKAVQVAFDASEELSAKVRMAATRNGISASDQIRKIVGLPVSSRPKRPRLTVSLSEADYELLAKRYKMTHVDKQAIKAKVMEELRRFKE